MLGSSPKVVVVIAGENQTEKVFKEVNQSLAGLDAMSSSMKGLLGGIGLGVAAKEVVEFLGSVLEVNEGLGKLSQKVGMNTEFLSGLRASAKLADVEFEQLSGGLEKFNRAISNAGSGSKAEIDAFKALGISVREIKTLSPEQLFLKVADSMNRAEDGAGKTAVAMKLFGRSGAELIPLLDQGSEGIRKVSDDLEKMGGKVTAADAAVAEKFNDSLKKLKIYAESAANQFLEGLSPALDAFADKADSATTKTTSLWKELGKVLGLTGAGIKIGVKLAFSKPGTGEAAAGVKEFDKLLQKLGFGDPEPIPMAVSHGTGATPKGKKKQITLGSSDENDKNLKARQALIEAAAQREAGLAEAARKTHIASLELEKAQGLITLKDYYTQRLGIVQSGLDAEISALEDKAVAQATKMAGMSDKAGRDTAAAELQKTLGEIDKKTEERKQLVLQTSAEELDAERQLANTVLGYEAEIQVAKGQTAAAAVQAIRTEFEERRRNMAAAGGDTSGLDMLEKQRIAAAQAEALATEIEAAYQRIQNNTQRIANLVATHQITEIEGERLMNKLRMEGADSVEAMVREYERLAIASGKPELLTNVDNLKLKQEELRIKVSQVADTVAGDLQSSFMSFFDGIATGSETAGQAFGNFALSVLRSIEQMIAKMIAMAIVMKVIGFFGSMFGGGIKAGGFSGTSTTSGFPGIPMFADGGAMRMGQMGIVGENGPELFVPNSSGRIIPNSELGATRGGGHTFHIEINAPNSDVQAVRQLEAKMPALLEGAVQRAVAVTEDQRIRRGM